DSAWHRLSEKEFVPHRTQAFLLAFHLHLWHTQLPKHIDTAPYPAPPGTISLPATLPANTPNTFLYVLIRNKHASHIEIFAKIVHEISFFSTNPGYKY
ncbi:hypothetical protein ACSLPG_33095, partial [Escherichia coli]|uniref:hypothetical protein n=1 Tax=Escherichia coli TaxID=562 RepID=UPI003EE41844